jgi:zinc D-Ala-D-Ala dipeptidase
MCRINISLIILSLWGFFGCIGKPDKPVVWPQTDSSGFARLTRPSDTSSFEQTLLSAGLVNVEMLDSTILVDLRYGSEENFLGFNFYRGFQKCYLQKEGADKLLKAQKNLKVRNPDLSLLVWDAARPLSVQWAIWRAVKPPPGLSKGFLVSNPARGSLHNFGCAVDVTIAGPDGKPIDMGTDFDCFEETAWPAKEQKMLKDAKLTEAQVTNRRLLRSVMYAAGFWNIQTEWWHFNAMRRETAIARYSLIP